MSAKKKRVIFMLLLTIICIITTGVLLVYKELAPEDDQAAVDIVYVISPTGNDTTGDGVTRPWKTIAKANTAAASGSTIILEDGVYEAYSTITKSSTTWRARNKHKAIIDGGFAPSMLAGNWDNIVSVWNGRCNTKGKGQFKPLLNVQNASGVTIDGLFLRNSCGRGIGVTTKGRTAKADYVTFRNNRIDWTFNSGVFARPEIIDGVYPNQMNNFQFINNIVTRVSIGDEYNVRVLGACKPGVLAYCVNISTAFGGVNNVVRGNIIAWGEGEVTVQPGSTGSVFENNILIGNKNSYYIGMVENSTLRNNLFYAPETPKTMAGGEIGDEARGEWRFGLRNEKGHLNMGKKFNTNIAIYNNLIVNTSFFITGSNDDYAGDNKQIYFGNNTLVAGRELEDMLRIGHTQTTKGTDPVLTGIFENNIIDIRKNPSTLIEAKLTGNDQFTFRNNLWPEGVTQSVRGAGDVYSNDSGMVNSTVQLNLTYPNIGPETIDIDGLLRALDVNNYRLKSTSRAKDLGTASGGLNSTLIPTAVRSQDYYKLSRDSRPDIGSIEYR